MVLLKLYANLFSNIFAISPFNLRAECNNVSVFIFIHIMQNHNPQQKAQTPFFFAIHRKYFC